VTGISPAAPLPLVHPTAPGVVMGTPRFVSPEAARGEEVDHRADLYAAGLLLYGMIAGKGPFDHHRDARELLEAHAREPPSVPSTFRADLPPGFEVVLLKSLNKQPDQRYASAREFARALAPWADVPSRADRRSPTPVQLPTELSGEPVSESMLPTVASPRW